MNYKTCSICKQHLPVIYFNKNKDRIRSECRECKQVKDYNYRLAKSTGTYTKNTIKAAEVIQRRLRKLELQLEKEQENLTKATINPVIHPNFGNIELNAAKDNIRLCEIEIKKFTEMLKELK